MNIWLIMLLGGLLTFGMRFSFVLLLGKSKVPSAMRRALRFVPPAVLSAIALPDLLLKDGQLAIGTDNIRLLAGLAAVLVAAWTKNSLLTILAGMVSLLIMQALAG